MIGVATCGSKSRSKKQYDTPKDWFHSPKRTTASFVVFLQKEAFKAQTKLRTSMTHDWSPLCSLTNRGSLSVLPTVLGLVFQRIRADSMAFQANVCRVWLPLISFQCTSGSNKRDEWAAEVLSVIYAEFRCDRRLGSDFMALSFR